MKLSIRVHLLAITAVLVVGIPGALSAQNLVTNSGFETGNLTGWTLAPGGPFDAVCAAGNPIGASTCIANTGTYAMSFGLAGAQDNLTQSITTIAGARYNFSFYLANDNPNRVGTETFDVFWDGTNVFSLGSPQASFPYGQSVFLSLLASTNSTEIKFAARHDPAQWFLDDVNVSVVPEPATMTLLATGLVGMAAARRRKRQA